MSDPTPLKVLFHPAPTPGLDGEPRTHPAVALSVDPAELGAWLRRRLSVNARPSALSFREPDLLHIGSAPDRALGDEAPGPAPVRAARRVMPLPSGRGLLAEAREAARAFSAAAAAEQEEEIDPFGFEAGLNAAAAAAVTSGRSALPAPHRSYLRTTAPRKAERETDPFFGADAVAYDEPTPEAEPEETIGPDAIVAAAGYWEDSPLEEAQVPETGELGIESLWADEPDLPADPVGAEPAPSPSLAPSSEPLPSFEFRPPSILLPDSELPSLSPLVLPPPLVVSFRALTGTPAEAEETPASPEPSTDLAAATRPLTVPPLVVSLRSLAGTAAEAEAPDTLRPAADLSAAVRPLTVPPLVVSFQALGEAENPPAPADLSPTPPTPVTLTQPVQDDLLDSLLD